MYNLLMALVIHIIIALSSLGFSIYLLSSPSSNKIKVSYGLIASTIASGTYLAVLDSSQILRVCATGLLFSGVSVFFVVLSRKKLAIQD